MKKSILFLSLLFILSFASAIELAGYDNLCLEKVTCGGAFSFHAKNYELSGTEIFFKGGGELIINSGLPNQVRILAGENVSLTLSSMIFYFQGKGGTVFLNGIPFSNIFSRENSDISQMRINPLTSDILSAYFFVNENGGRYKINGVFFLVKPNSKFSYEKGKVLQIKNSQIESIEEGLLQSGIKIEGEHLLMGDGSILDGRGTLNSKGFLLEYGKFSREGIQFSSGSSSEEILFVKKASDFLDCTQNCVKSFDNSLNIKSGIDQRIQMKFLENSILNTDKKDKLNFLISEGDQIKFQNRNNQGLIPQLEYLPSEKGKTYMVNDGLTFSLDKKGVKLEGSPKGLDAYVVNNEKYQSVAMEIKSPKNPNNLRINSYRQFVYLDEKKGAKVSFNDYGLEVSDKLEYNKVQTIEQLRVKYPEIKFEIPEEISVDVKNGFKSEIPPGMVHSTDKYLQQNPNSLKEIKKFKFGDDLDAYADAEKRLIYIGMKISDPASRDFQVREVLNPIEIIAHEGRHVHQGEIKDEETEIIQNTDAPKTSKLIKERLEKKEELKRMRDTLFDPDAKRMMGGKKWIELISKKDKLRDRVAELYFKIRKEYYLETGKKSLDYIYSSMGLEKQESFFEKGGLKSIIRLKEKIDKDFFSDKLNDFIKRKYGKDIYSVGIELSNEYEKKMAKEYGAEPTFYENVEEYKEMFENNRGFANSVLLNSLQEKDDLKKSERKNLDVLSKNQDFINVQESDLLDSKATSKTRFNAILKLYSFITKNSELQKQAEKMDSIIRDLTGIPYQYSLQNYGAGGEKVEDNNFLELSTTFLEQPIDVLRQRMSSNPIIKETYTSLTQLSFDSGEINSKKYSEILGLSCSTPDCLEFKCLKYKLVCCEENPTSPNC